MRSPVRAPRQRLRTANRSRGPKTGERRAQADWRLWRARPSSFGPLECALPAGCGAEAAFGILAFARLLLRLDRGRSRNQEKCARYRVAHPFPHTKTSFPFVSHIGSTDCGQAPKGCKGRKKISPGIFPLTGQSVPRRVGHLATPPLEIVSFLLTPQVRRRRIPATFSVGIWSRGPERKNWRVIPQGEKRAVFAGMDCAMH